MMDVMEGLYQVVQERKEEKREGSYTCYLFEQGLDKILKKCGDEIILFMRGMRIFSGLRKWGLMWFL